jgi:outer membrane protein assembly factor BamB
MKKQVNPTVKIYLAQGALCLMLSGVCAVPFALAQQGPKNHSSRLRQSRQPVVRRAPRRDLGTDQSVAWQNDAIHDGFDPASSLVPPLVVKWSRDLSASVFSISYPLIAQGLVFITSATTTKTMELMALDEHTGATVWSADVGNCCFANAAYDSGKVFVVNNDGLMKAFDAAAGTPLWSVNLPGQSSFTSPPTASNGIVFTGGAGSGGTAYAVDETNGAVLWTMPVENGDHSSPAVIEGNVYVSYACPQAYGFNTATGQQLWHYESCCEGGGGKTPVVHDGQVYVRDSFCTPGSLGLVLDAGTGTKTGEFNSDVPPAFIGDLAVYLQSGTLRGVDLPSAQVVWSFAGDGGLQSAPLIVNETIYIGSSFGTLFGLNTSGEQIWSTQVGSTIPAPDEQNQTVTTGLGAGDGLLIVPADTILVAYGAPNTSPTPTPSPTPNVTPTPTLTPPPRPTPTPRLRPTPRPRPSP